MFLNSVSDYNYECHDFNNGRRKANSPLFTDNCTITFLINGRMTRASFQAMGKDEKLSDLLNRMDNGVLSCCARCLSNMVYNQA